MKLTKIELIKMVNDAVENKTKAKEKQQALTIEQNKVIRDLQIEHRIMKRIIKDNGLWETLLNDDEFLRYLREEYQGQITKEDMSNGEGKTIQE